MAAIAKIKSGWNLSVIAPLTISIGIVSTSLSPVQSQTLPKNNQQVSPLPAAAIAQLSEDSKQTPAAVFLNASQYQTLLPEPAKSVTVTDKLPSTAKTITANPRELAQLLPTTPASNQSAIPAPMPGTNTNANTLNPQPSVVNQSKAKVDTPEVAQLPVDPGSVTRGGSSYVGIGGNIGLSGDTALGDGNFMIISKIGLTRALALRPGVILGDDAVFLIPLTYEFSIRRAEALEETLRIAPYVGAGVTIATGNDDDNSDIGLLLTGGIDIPLNNQFTANAGLNVGIADETDIGISVGVGYNFSGFGL